MLPTFVASLSGACHDVELAILIWGYTKRGIRPGLRERVWRGVEKITKWSFIGVIIDIVLFIELYVDVSVATIHCEAKVTLLINSRLALYAFLWATHIPMCLGRIFFKLLDE